MLVDDTGRPLKKGKSPEEVKDILKTLRPKNKEQEVLLARRIAETLEASRRGKMRNIIEDDPEGVFKANREKRIKDDNWSKNKDYRHIASIPKEMVYVAEKIWGPKVLTDPQLFREAFVKDEMGQYCLTVDPKTI